MNQKRNKTLKDKTMDRKTGQKTVFKGFQLNRSLKKKNYAYRKKPIMSY